MPRGRVVINAEACKGCQLCITICPSELVQMADSFNTKGFHPAQLVDPERLCSGCTLCAMICPDAAIVVFREVKVKPHAAHPREVAAPLREAD